MRGVTSVIVQTHQILRLPRKMNLMIDPWHKWNVIYNARSNMRHSPKSPNTAPATKNDRPKSQRNWLKTDETSFPMRGRSEHDPSMIRAWSDHETVSPQPASQPRLPFTPTTSILYWKIQHFALWLSFQISPNTAPATKSDTWTSRNTAPATKSDTWTSQNTAPATKNESHDWSLSHMKRYLQCAEQQVSLSKLTKYCACHAKWISWLILDTNETLFTMRGATRVIVQTHQILRLPRKMNLMIDPWHKWNVIYNARSNMRHSPNSPNTAPATKNDRPESQRNWLKTDETSFPMRGRSDHDPRMIREWSENETVSPQPASQPRLPFTPTTSILYWKLQHFALRLSFQISPNTAPATKSDTRTSPNTAPATKSDTWTSQNTAPATKSDTWTSPNTAPATKSALLLDWAMTSQSYDLTELWLDWAVTWLSYYWAVTWLSYDLTELWRDWAVTWLSCDVTELWLDWAVTWLSCDLTELWRDWAVTWLNCDLTELWLDWAMTWLSCDLTELWLDWAVTWLSCDLTELWRDWAVTWLSCDLTELWLDWAVTWLSYDLTELWLDWAVTWLSCDLTELWLDWAVTWLSCDVTELWLDWTVTWLSCDLTELRCDVVRISEVSQLNFLR